MVKLTLNFRLPWNLVVMGAAIVCNWRKQSLVIACWIKSRSSNIEGGEGYLLEELVGESINRFDSCRGINNQH